MSRNEDQSGQGQDIEHALRESEERYDAVLETAVNAIIIMGEDRRIRLVNTAAEKMFGYTRNEMVGQNVSMLMPQPYRDEHDHYVSRYLETNEPKIIGIGREVMARRKDGTTFPIDLSVGEAELAEGKLFTGIIRDLSERKRLERKLAEVSEEEKRRIGRDLHDDICQQLAGIGCLVKVLQQQRKDVGPAHESLDEIGRMVADVNAHVREMARGLVPVVLESEGLATALRELAASSSHLFGVSCRFLGSDVDVNDQVARVHLYRIAQEAITNAVKHGQAESIRISLEEQDSTIVLLIHDDGTGIPDKPQKGHTGMGLLTMDHRAKMLNGEVRIESVARGGTTIRCAIPNS